MIRCVLWSESGMAGVRVWDPTPLAIPAVPSGSLYPSVQWGWSRTQPLGKWSWFQLPVTLAAPDPTAPLTTPIPRIVEPVRPPVTGGFPRLSPDHLSGPIDRFFEISSPAASA